MSSFLSTRASTDSALSRFSSCSSLHSCFSSTPPQSRRGSQDSASDAGAAKSCCASPARRVYAARPPIAPRTSSLLVDLSSGPEPDLALRPPTSPDAGARRARRSPSMEWRQSLMRQALMSFVAPVARRAADPAPRVRNSSASVRSGISSSTSAPAIGPVYAFGSTPRPRNHRRTRRFYAGRGISSADVPLEAYEADAETDERRRSMPKSVSDASVELRRRIEAHEVEERTRWFTMRRRMAYSESESAGIGRAY